MKKLLVLMLVFDMVSMPGVAARLENPPGTKRINMIREEAIELCGFIVACSGNLTLPWIPCSYIPEEPPYDRLPGDHPLVEFIALEFGLMDISSVDFVNLSCVSPEIEILGYYDALGPVDVYMINGELSEIISTVSISELAVVDPNGGESLVAGSAYTIRWADFRSESNCGGTYAMEHSADNGENWSAIVSNYVSSSCRYDWLVPAINSDKCLLRITDASDPNVSDTSDKFTIYECTLTVDLTGDCVIDLADLAVLAAEWLKCGNPFDPNCLP